METGILDSIVREAIVKAAIGEFSRRTTWKDEEDDPSTNFRIPLDIPFGRIIYTVGENLTVVGDCHSAYGIKEKSDPPNIITPNAVEKYKIPKKKQEGNGAKYGVLVDSTEDNEWRSARFERVVIQYIHNDAIMNIGNYGTTTDLTGETLLQAMERVRAEYNVEIGYLDGIEQHDWHYPENEIGGAPINWGLKPKEQQNNVFQKEFNGTATVDDLVTGIRNVYAAGEAFKAGVYKLREEKAAKLQEEAGIKDANTRAIVTTF